MTERLLKRQLKKLGIDENRPPDAQRWREFVASVNLAYEQTRQERDLLERSLTLSSREMQELYEQTRTLNAELEQRVAERTDALWESEQRLRALFDSSPDAIFVEDLAGNVLDVNPAACQLHGMTRDELVGKHVSALVPPERREDVAKSFQAQIAGDVTHLDSVSWTKDGRAVPVEIRMSAIEYAGKPALLLHVRDVTTRKRTEEALQASQEQYRRIVENIQDGLTIIEGRDVVYVNERICEIFGYSAAELAKLNPLNLAAPEEQARLQEMMTVARREGTSPSELEFWIVRKDGTRRFIRNRYSVSRKDGEIVGRYVFTTDLTERELAEQRYRSFFENAVFGIYQSTPDGQILSINPEMARICGYASPAEMIESVQDIERQVYVTAGRRAEFMHVLEEEGLISEFESQIYRKDGSLAWISESARAMRDNEGRVLYYEGMVADITERKQAEERLVNTQALLGAAIDQTPAGVIVADAPDVHIRLANAAALGIRGRDRDSLTDIPVELHPSRWQVFYPDGAPCAPEDLPLSRAILRGETTRDEELIIRRETGEDRWVLASAAPVRNAAGAVVAGIVVFPDITDRKHTEEQIRQQNAFLNTILESLTHPFYVIDVGTYEIKMANSAARQGSVAATTCYALTHRRDTPCGSAEHPCPVEEVKRTKSGVVVEHIHYDEEGQPRHVEVHGYPIFDDAGNVAQVIEYSLDITEHRRAEEALKESESRLNALVDFLPDATLVIDRKGQVLVWNRAMEALTGVAAEDMLGKGNYEYAVPFYGKRKPILVDSVLKPTEGIESEYENITKLGDKLVGENYVPGLVGGARYLLGTAAKLYDSKGAVTGAIEIIRDITERKLTEKDLQESQRALVTLMSNLPGMAYRCRNEPDWPMQFISEGCVALTGYQPEDLMEGGEITFGELTHPEDRDRVWGEIQTALQEQQPFQVTYRITTAQGHEKWLWGQGRGIFSAEGAVEALEGFITDITERKEAEEQLHRLSLALEQSGDGITITDLDGVVQFVNDAWVRMHQYFDAAELLGKPLSMFHTAEQLEERKEDLPSEQAKQRGVYSGEVEHLRRDGTVFPTAMTVTLLHDEGGQPTGLIASARDITTERHLRDISQGLAAAMTLEDVVQIVVEPVAKIAGADRGMIILFEDWVGDEPTITHMLAGWDLATRKVIFPNRRAPYKQYAIGKLVRDTADVIVIDDIHDARLKEIAPNLESLGVQHVAIVPWISRERVIGFSFMERRQDTPFDYADLQAAQTAVNQGALAVSSIQQVEERQRELQVAAARRAEEVATGTEIAQAIAAVPALNVLYETVVTLIKERFDYYHTQIFRYEPGVNAVVLVVGYGEVGQRMRAAGHKLEMGRGVVGTAAATGEPQLAADVTEDPAWRPNPNLPDTKGELAVPIKLRGEVLGVLDVQSDVAGALTENDLVLLQGICGQIAAAIESTQLRQETERRLREISTLYRDYTRAAWESYQQEREYEKANAYFYDGMTIQSEVAVPAGATISLKVRGETIGKIGVAEDPNRVWTEEELALVETVAEQVAQAMERGRLFEQTQRTLDETRALYEASRALIAAPDELAVLQRLVENLDVRTLDRVVVAMVVGVQDGGRLVEVKAVWDRAGKEEHFLGNQFTSAQIPLIEQAGRTNIFLINDVDTSAELDDISRITFKRLGIRSVAVLPMTVGDELLGWILLETTTAPRVFTREQVQPYLALANQAAIAIQNRRLFQTAQRRAQRERMIREITAKMRASTDLDTILNTAVEELGKSLGVSRTFVRLTTGVTGGDDVEQMGK